MFSWDGRADPPTDAQGNPVLDASGNPVPGPVQPKGVYLFQLSLNSSVNDTDTDKSTALSFGVPATQLALNVGTNDTSGETDTLSYNLTDQYNLTPLSCRLDVYQNWDFTDLVPNKQISSALGQNSVTFLVPQPGQPSEDDMVGETKLIYLVSPQDSDKAHDKGHRNRFALQHNKAKFLMTLLTWGGYYPLAWDSFTPVHIVANHQNKAETVTEANHADKMAAKLGYNLWRSRGYWDSLITQITPQTLLFKDLPAKYIGSPTNPVKIRDDCPYGLLNRAIDVAVLSGHGRGGTAFMFGTAADNNANPDSPSDAYFVVTTDLATEKTWEENLSGTFEDASKNFWNLSSAVANLWGGYYQNGTLVHGPVQLFVWAGCDTAGDFSGTGLPQKTCSLGANCSVGFQGDWFVKDITAVIDKLVVKNGRGRNNTEMQDASKGQTIYQAFHHAIDLVKHTRYLQWQTYVGLSFNANNNITVNFALPKSR